MRTPTVGGGSAAGVVESSMPARNEASTDLPALLGPISSSFIGAQRTQGRIKKNTLVFLFRST
jgi:hypothetical protein